MRDYQDRPPKERGAYSTGGWCRLRSKCANDERKCSTCVSIFGMLSEFVEKETKKEDG